MKKQRARIMRKAALFICVLMTCFICGAKEITIIPQFVVGDTIRYRATTNIVMHHDKDSLVSTTKLLPTLIVEEKNNRGFVIRTTNSLEDISVECSDPEAVEIPTSMILTGDLLKMCHGVNELNMEITTLDSDIESSINADDGMYSISIMGKEGTTEIEGLLLYGGGIMNHGILSVKTESGSERMLTTYMIEAIN